MNYLEHKNKFVGLDYNYMNPIYKYYRGRSTRSGSKASSNSEIELLGDKFKH